ncbi:hypothetical protein [Caloranaerobacter sp. DY30410]|uniref:hypothetical protein n=1 Tax=Caloranaerobacter sp. DY30410 TaxID=3238305 RepID=UPI003D067F1E
MNKLFNKFRILLMLLILVLTFVSINNSASAQSYEKVKPMSHIYWINTYRTHTETKWELAKRNYSSKLITETYHMTKRVIAKNAAEAKRKVAAGIDTEIDYKIVNVSISGDGEWYKSKSGEYVTEWKVKLEITEKYIQYYDLYKKYKYTYYIGALVNEQGTAFDYDYHYELKSKTPTGDTMLKKNNKTEAP